MGIAPYLNRRWQSLPAFVAVVEGAAEILTLPPSGSLETSLRNVP
jgi:hypothetical protein